MRICKIIRTRRGRFALLDEQGQTMLSADAETLHKHRIQEGSLLDAAGLADLLAETEARCAKDTGLRLLAMRSHARQELYQKLCRRYHEQAAAAAVEKLQQLGLLDDEQFARKNAQALAARHHSAQDIRARLLLRGVSRETVQAVVDDLQLDSQSDCEHLLRSRYRTKLLKGKTEQVLAALARRGFPYRQARCALEQVCSELEQELQEEAQEA